MLATIEVIIGRPDHVIGNHQIQARVLVIIEESGARTPLPSISNTGLSGDVAESTIPVVMIEDRSVPTYHIKIHEAVIVVVACGNSEPKKSFGPDVRFSGDIRKSPISIIPVQSTPEWISPLIQPRLCALNKV